MSYRGGGASYKFVSAVNFPITERHGWRCGVTFINYIHISLLCRRPLGAGTLFNLKIH